MSVERIIGARMDLNNFLIKLIKLFKDDRNKRYL